MPAGLGMIEGLYCVRYWFTRDYLGLYRNYMGLFRDYEAFYRASGKDKEIEATTLLIVI